MTTSRMPTSKRLNSIGKDNAISNKAPAWGPYSFSCVFWLSTVFSDNVMLLRNKGMLLRNKGMLLRNKGSLLPDKGRLFADMR